MFDQEWSAQEELLLLEGLQTMGFGNWTDIAKQIGTKSKEQCELHYMNFWFRDSGASFFQLKDKLSRETLKRLDIQRVQEIVGEVKALEPDFEEHKTVIEQKLAIYEDKINKVKLNQKVETSFNDILGFMPLRRDFDVEYDNEAELFLAEMEFSRKLR